MDDTSMPAHAKGAAQSEYMAQILSSHRHNGVYEWSVLDPSER